MVEHQLQSSGANMSLWFQKEVLILAPTKFPFKLKKKNPKTLTEHRKKKKIKIQGDSSHKAQGNFDLNFFYRASLCYKESFDKNGRVR